MKWSIFVDGTTNNADVDKWVKDIKTDAPDGVYPVAFPYLDIVGNGDGVTVKNGKFVLEPTIKAIKEAVEDAKYWGTYIEGLIFEEEYDHFEVSIGS